MSIFQHVGRKEEAASSCSNVSGADCCLDSCFCISILVENKQPSLKLIILCHNNILSICREMTIFISVSIHQSLIYVLFLLSMAASLCIPFKQQHWITSIPSLW